MSILSYVQTVSGCFISRLLTWLYPHKYYQFVNRSY